MKKVYVCNDNVTGLFSAIYEAWRERPEDMECGISLKEHVEQQLFCEYVEVEETEHKAETVEYMILKNLGMEVYEALYLAALSRDPEKGDAILGTMLAARRIPNSKMIMNHLSHPMVEKVFELWRNVGGEAHNFKGFLRFRELQSGILFAECEPKNRILTCLAPHFADRMPIENWMIYDRTYGEIAIHEAKKQWVLVSDEDFDLEKSKSISENEKIYAEMWKGFCKTISIEARENKKRQIQHLPLWQRTHMVEFDKR